MDTHRQDDAHQLTPRFYKCKACGAMLRMRIEPPFWFCRNCHTKHVPADLQLCDPPSEEHAGEG